MLTVCQVYFHLGADVSKVMFPLTSQKNVKYIKNKNTPTALCLNRMHYRLPLLVLECWSRSAGGTLRWCFTSRVVYIFSVHVHSSWSAVVSSGRERSGEIETEQKYNKRKRPLRYGNDHHLFLSIFRPSHYLPNVIAL